MITYVKKADILNILQDLETYKCGNEGKKGYYIAMYDNLINQFFLNIAKYNNLHDKYRQFITRNYCPEMCIIENPCLRLVLTNVF